MDTGHVSNRHLHPQRQATLRNSYGTMEAREATVRAGSKMSRGEKLSEMVKWLKTWGVGTLFSIFVISICIYVTFRTQFQSYRQSFWLDGKYYEMIGLSKVQDNGRILFIPIFEEKK